MKGCGRARELVLASLDREIGLTEALALQAHVAECDTCARFERVHRLIEEGVQRLPEPALDRLDMEGASASLRMALQAQPPLRLDEAQVASRASRHVGMIAAIVVGAALLSWGGLSLLRSHDGSAVPVGRSDELPTLAFEVGVTGEGRQEPAAAPAVASIGLANVRALCREHLAAAFAGGTSDVDREACLRRFDELTAPLSDELWPLIRIVEDLVDDDDPHVACAAARVLGWRGDLVSVARLRAALSREDVALAAILALADRGAGGADALAHVLTDPALSDLSEPALRGLCRIGGPEAAAALDELFRDARTHSSLERDELLDGLAEVGPAAVRSLLRLANDGLADRRAILARLELVDDAEGELVRVLAGRDGFSTELLLAAAVALQSDGALAWVEECCRDGVTRPAALAALAQWEGIDPWRSLLRLYVGGQVTREEEVGTARLLIEHDSTRVAAFARELARTGAAASSSELLALLLACESEGTGTAFIELALSIGLPPDDRQWAALAAGELGDARDVELLAKRIAELGSDESRLLAACLLSMHTLAGAQAVETVLAHLPQRSVRRVVEALADAAERSAAIGLHHVVRALDDAYVAHSFLSRRSTL